MATVLIVEDEDSLRETLSRYLTHEGYDVITASSGSEALEAGFGASPDVLVADWMLKNHIHGLHVSEVFRALHPKLNTILITGFPSRDLFEASDRCGVTRLLEKPFDLRDLQEAVRLAATGTPLPSDAGPPIAAMAVSPEGEIVFASDRAGELLESLELAREGPVRLEALIGAEALERVGLAESDWVEVRTQIDPPQTWLMRARARPGGIGWIVVFCPLEEEQRRSDPRVRILLDERVGSAAPSLEGRGPVLVIERDGVVRRLLVSQIERIGALCYPSDDLQSAIRLLVAESRIRTVMVDCALAGPELAAWTAQIRAARPEATIIGTGAIGDEAEMRSQGVVRVLRKPWRMQDLLAAIDD